MALGVETFFGVPGGPVILVFDAVLKCGRGRASTSPGTRRRAAFEARWASTARAAASRR